jgi:ankyrin repeat protein
LSVRLLLEHNADVDACNKCEKRLLILLWLRKRQLNKCDSIALSFFTSDGRTALMLASRSGHAEIVLFLLQNGADANAVDRGTFFLLFFFIFQLFSNAH